MERLSIEKITENVRESDGLFSVIDTIRFCGKADPYKTLERLRSEYSTTMTKCQNRQFMNKAGQKTKATPAATPVVMLEIIGLLPGAIGRSYRQEAAKLVHQYLTDKAGLAEKLVEQIDNPEDLKRIKARAEGKIRRVEFADTVYNALPSKTKQERGRAIAKTTNSMYRELFGTTAKGLRQERKLAPKTPTRDGMSGVEIGAVMFAEILATETINNNLDSHLDNARRICSTSSQKAKAVKDLLDSTK